MFLETLRPAFGTALRALTAVDRLHVKGMGFETLDGRRHRSQLADAYILPHLLMEGRDVGLYLDYVSALGANGVSSFLQSYGWMETADESQWDARSYIAPIEDVKPTARMLAARGYYWNPRILCEPVRLGQSKAQQIDRVAAVLDALKDEPNIEYLTIANEPKNSDVGDVWFIVDALGLADPSKRRGLLLDSGDYYLMDAVEQGYAFRCLDGVGDHGPRKDDWTTEAPKFGSNFVNGWPADQYNRGFPGLGPNRFVVAAEWVKFASDVDGPNEQRIEAAEEGAAGIAVASGGGTYHSVAGILCQVPADDSVDARAARAWFAAMDAVPLDVPDGHYAHDGTGGFPLSDKRNALEATGRVNGNTAYIVGSNIDGDYWRPTVAGGWRLLEQKCSKGQLAILERT